MTLQLGDVVPLGGELYVVATVTGIPPQSWQLVRVPAGAKPLDLGITWKRSDTDYLTLFQQPSAPPSASLEPPQKPPEVEA